MGSIPTLGTKYAALAQSVELQFSKLNVIGSTPVATSKENKMGLDMNAYKVKPDSWW